MAPRQNCTGPLRRMNGQFVPSPKNPKPRVGGPAIIVRRTATAYLEKSNHEEAWYYFARDAVTGAVYVRRWAASGNSGTDRIRDRRFSRGSIRNARNSLRLIVTLLTDSIPKPRRPADVSRSWTETLRRNESGAVGLNGQMACSVAELRSCIVFSSLGFAELIVLPDGAKLATLPYRLST
jgi:hypothetical protein